MLKQRVLTAMVLLALFLSALFWLPELVWQGLLVLMVAQGATEWTRMAQLSPTRGRVFWWISVLGMLGLFGLDSQLQGETQVFVHLALYVLPAIFWLMVVPTWMMIGWKVRDPLLLMFTGWLVLLPTALAMQDLRAETPKALLFVMALVWIADSAAYFTGRKFGRNKLAPSISPGKTWEGVIGALVGVTIYVVCVSLITPAFGSYPPLFPGLILASWWWVGLAVMGDLFESLLKRQAGLKDSGALLPGHGGLLDRIDALTSTLPLAAMAILMQKLG